MKSSQSLQVEACFSPGLYQFKLTKKNFIVVVADIFRASTSICAALDHGVKRIIPVGGIEIAKEYKEKGYFVACERDGRVLDFADVGNSPSDFLHAAFLKETIVYSTTNGTKAIQLASDADEIVIGSFVNLSSLAAWLVNQEKNVVILCSGWKNLFNLEDSIFAGALAKMMLDDTRFTTFCDSVKAAVDLWSMAGEDLASYLTKSSHRNRLKHLVTEEDYQYTVTPDSTRVVPLFRDGSLTDIYSKL
jgi:2-phosphosulfolactate phosphatase